MAIVSLTANVYAGENRGDASAIDWTAANGELVAVMPASRTSKWYIWQFQAAVPPGESFNGVVIKGNASYTYGGGGGGRTRIGRLYGAVQPDDDDFFTAIPSTLLASAPGTGAGVAVNGTPKNAAMTSDNLIAGTFYVGYKVNTDSAESSLGAGPFKVAAFNWDIYTGPDNPDPPPGTENVSINNPSSNASGRKAGESFLAIVSTVNNPAVPDQYFSLEQTLPAGITFVDTGVQVNNFAKGTVQDPGNPFSGSTGAMLVGANAVPGSYSLRIKWTTGIAVYDRTVDLTVLPTPGGGGFFMEV